MYGMQLRKFRESAHMTQSQVADAINKSRSAISKIENDEQEIDVFSLVQWAKVTNAEAQVALLMFGADVIVQAAHIISLVPAMIFTTLFIV